MINQFTKSIIGAAVLVTSAAMFLPIFFPGEEEPVLTGIPGGNQPVVDDKKTAANSNTSAEQKGTAQSDSEESANSDSYDGDYEDDGSGFGGLLDDEGAPAPSGKSSGDNKNVHSGVVLGAADGTGSQHDSNFVANPTASGSSPAEAARAEKERSKELAQRKIEEEKTRKAEQEEQARIKAEQNAQLNEKDLTSQNQNGQNDAAAAAEAKAYADQQKARQQALAEQQKIAAAKAKADALAKQKADQDAKDRLAAQQKADQDAKDRLAAQQKADQDAKDRLAAQQKADQDAKAKADALEKQKAAEAEQKKQEAAAAAAAAPKSTNASGHYLQVGVFSTEARAQDVVSSLRSAKIAVPGKMRQYLSSGFGYKIDSSSKKGVYYVLVGPVKSNGDALLHSIKPKVDDAVRVNSSIVRR